MESFHLTIKGPSLGKEMGGFHIYWNCGLMKERRRFSTYIMLLWDCIMVITVH